MEKFSKILAQLNRLNAIKITHRHSFSYYLSNSIGISVPMHNNYRDVSSTFFCLVTSLAPFPQTEGVKKFDGSEL